MHACAQEADGASFALGTVGPCGFLEDSNLRKGSKGLLCCYLGGKTACIDMCGN